jgi:hypothetical protein
LENDAEIRRKRTLEVGGVLYIPLCPSAHIRNSYADNHQHGGSHHHDAHDHRPILRSLLQRCTIPFTQPGIYTANPEPNLEDISTHKKNKGDVKRSDKKKIVSDQIREKDLNDVIQEEDEMENISKHKPHKKISIEEKEEISRQEQLKQSEKDSLAKVPSNNILEMGKAEGSFAASAKNIISVAKNVLGNFTSFMSKKEIEPALEEAK